MTKQEFLDAMDECRTQEMRNYRATGKTKINQYEGLSLDSLKHKVDELTPCFKKFGYKVNLESIQQ